MQGVVINTKRGNMKIVKMLCVLYIINSLNISALEESSIIVTEEWPPFSYLENGEITGISTDIVRAILKYLNKDINIILYPGLRARAVLDTTPTAIMYSFYRTPEREQNYRWVGPIGDGSIFFYKLRGSDIEIKSIEDAKRVNTIACRSRGLIPDLLESMGFNNLDRSGTDGSHVYLRLLHGRCDLAISDTDLGARYVLNKIGVDFELIERIPVLVYQADFYIACNKKYPEEDVQKWTDALNFLKDSGVIYRIRAEYRQ